MGKEQALTEAEELREELRELRRQVSELKSREDMPPPTMALAKYDLSENEQTALRLLALGLNQKEASELAGRNDSYVNQRLRDSAEFALAYKDVREEFDVWREARLKFILPQMWREIDLIINSVPEDYVKEGNTDYAKALLKAKTTVIDKILRHNYTKTSDIVHKHEIDIPMLQLAQNNILMLAEHMQGLALADNRGELEARLPENQIIELFPEQHLLRFNEQPRRDDGRFRCLECGAWIVNLRGHVTLQHNMELKHYVVKHNIDPLEDLGVERSGSTAGT